MSKEVNEKGIATSIVILAVVVAALASGLVVSIVHYRGKVSVWESRHKSAEENYNDLKLDYENLQSRVESLIDERKSLRENLSKISEDLQRTKEKLYETEENYLSLQDDFSELTVSYQEALENYQTLSVKYESLRENYENLKSRYEDLEYSYTELQETYNLYNAELHKEVPFEIEVPEMGEKHREFSFDIGYGIIVTAKIDVSKDPARYYISESISWTRSGESGSLGSSGRAYTQLPEKLEGTAYCNILDSGGDFIEVKCGIRPQNQGWVGRDARGRFPKKLSD